MKYSICKTLVRIAVSTAIVCVPPLTWAQPNVQKESYEQLLGTVNALSASLQRDPGATSVDAKASMAKLAARQKEAEELASVGEYGVARSILDEGYRALTQTLGSLKSDSGYSSTMGSAPASAATGSGDAARKASYERQMGSAQALLDSARRSSAESQGARASDIGRIEAMLTKARSAAASGDFVSADTIASESMKELRPLLVAMKGITSEPKAVSATSAATVDPAKQRAAYEARNLTAISMLDALRRLNTEKHAGKETVIADIESRLGRAQTLRGSDPAAAIALLEETYALTRSTLQGMQGGASLKSGSAAQVAAQVTENPGGSDVRRAEAQRSLDSVRLIRNAAERIGRESGFDNAPSLMGIDTFVTDARNSLASDPARALKSAREANRLAKEALEKARAAR